MMVRSGTLFLVWLAAKAGGFRSYASSTTNVINGTDSLEIEKKMENDADAVPALAMEGLTHNLSLITNEPARNGAGWKSLFTAHTNVTFRVPKDKAFTGFSFAWSGTCNGSCESDGPVLREMKTYNASTSKYSGYKGEMRGGATSTKWSGEWYKRDLKCPGSYVTGIDVRTSGSCGGLCDHDGPVIKGIYVSCKTPPSWSSLDQGIEHMDVAQDLRPHAKHSLQCASGYFVTGLQVNMGGNCENHCATDGNMVQRLQVTCSLIGLP